MVRPLSVIPLLFAACLLFPARPAPAVGLGSGDSEPGLRAVRPPLRLTWTLDDATVRYLGGPADVGESMGAAVYRHLTQGGVPVQDGSFNPLREPFVSFDVWVRGATRPDDPKDPQVVFQIRFQVFAPASVLKGRPGKGRVEVWENGAFGACAATDVREKMRALFDIADAFAADWRRAHAPRGGLTP